MQLSLHGCLHGYHDRGAGMQCRTLGRCLEIIWGKWLHASWYPYFSCTFICVNIAEENSLVHSFQVLLQMKGSDSSNHYWEPKPACAGMGLGLKPSGM